MKTVLRFTVDLNSKLANTAALWTVSLTCSWNLQSTTTPSSLADWTKFRAVPSIYLISKVCICMNLTALAKSQENALFQIQLKILTLCSMRKPVQVSAKSACLQHQQHFYTDSVDKSWNYQQMLHNQKQDPQLKTSHILKIEQASKLNSVEYHLILMQNIFNYLSSDLAPYPFTIPLWSAWAKKL